MRMYLSLSLLLCCIFFTSYTFAQKNTLAKANKLFESYSYSKAILLYKLVINNSEENNILAKTRLAECYTMLNYYDEAEKWYNQIIDSTKLDTYHFLNYAGVLKSNGKYTEAKKWFLAYHEIDPNDTRVEKMIKSCDIAPMIIKDSLFYKIERLSFNSSASEFAPAIFKNKLAFSSNRDGSNIDEFTGYPFFDIYYVEKDSNDRWSGIQQFSSNINTEFHDGPVTFNKEGDVMYLTRNDPKIKKKSVSRYEIVKVEFIEDKWKITEEFPYNSGQYSVGHGSLSRDGSQLYFISDMLGGYGGKDIYVSYLKNDQWSEPENLGPSINTEENELFPFIHPDSTLYFSSNGHLGIGGLDIFASHFKNGNWTKPENLGYPINSSREDFGFIIDQDKEKGYFSSNRVNGGFDDDIFYFEETMPEFLVCDTMTGRSLCVILFESDSADLDSLPLIYQWTLGDGNVTKGNSVEHCYEKPGVYNVLLNVIDSATGETVFNDATYKLIVEEYPNVIINSKDSLLVNTVYVFDGSESSIDDCNTKKYYWIFEDKNMFEGEKAEYSFNNIGTHFVKLGVHGKSDSLAKSCLECIYKKVIVQNP